MGKNIFTYFSREFNSLREFYNYIFLIFYIKSIQITTDISFYKE